MARSGDDARRRLRDAALALFQERGYDATTAAQIAERAGVTERTFFRHFPDKREALFDGEEEFIGRLCDAVRAAPAELGPLDALLEAFRGAGPLIERNRSFTAPREEVIARTPALQERVHAKAAKLVAALAGVLGERGVDDVRASLAAEIGVATSTMATHRWFGNPGKGYGSYLDDAVKELDGLVSSRRGGAHRSA